MPRRVIAVNVLLGAGCLVPNPAWSGTEGASTQGTSATMGDTGTTESSGSSSESGSSSGGDLPPTAFCEPLPALPDDAVIVAAGSTVAQINDAIAGAGDVIALEPGTYEVGAQPIVLARAGVTLRSTTGDAADVIIDGGDTAELLVRVRASGVTIAGLTIAGSVSEGIVLGGETNIDGITLTHLQLVDILRGAVATVAAPAAGQYVDGVEIACSHFRITEERRIALTDTCPGFVAINMVATRDSVLRDSIFSDYFCDLLTTGSVTVRYTDGSRDTLVERNRFVNNYRALIFGGEDPALVTVPTRVYADDPCAAGYWGHIGGVVRNNLFWNGSDAILASAPGMGTRTDSAISFWTVCDGAAYHNTVVSLMDPDEIFAGIEWRWPTTTVEVVNNLVTDSLMQREAAVLTVGAGNLELANPNEVVDPLGGDLHLAPTANARGGGVPLPAVTEDFEGDARDEPPDAGADEFSE